MVRFIQQFQPASPPRQLADGSRFVSVEAPGSRLSEYSQDNCSCLTLETPPPSISYGFCENASLLKSVPIMGFTLQAISGSDSGYGDNQQQGNPHAPRWCPLSRGWVASRQTGRVIAQ